MPACYKEITSDDIPSGCTADTQSSHMVSPLRLLTFSTPPIDDLVFIEI
jgi:hypothetical protein